MHGVLVAHDRHTCMGVGCASKGAVNVPACAPHAGAALCGVVGHAKHIQAWGAWVLAKRLTIQLAKPLADLLLFGAYVVHWCLQVCVGNLCTIRNAPRGVDR